jgi:hypothetical protein
MSALNNSLLLGQEGGGGYAISRSLRFNSSDSAYLSRTPASAGNRKTWTWAGWVKRSRSGIRQALFAAHDGGAANYTTIEFEADQLGLFYGGTISGPRTTAVFRDPSAWMHICAVLDTTQATASDRVKLYVNGVQQVIGSGTYPSLNADLKVNAAVPHNIGSDDIYDFFSGYLADIHFIDGQALAPTSFGEFSATTGVWMPKQFAGSYGSQGWKLSFSDNSTAAALGTDSSGAGNTWTVNNISVTAGAGNDSLVDVPTNGSEVDTGAGGEVRGNYATLNPLKNTGNTLSNGNLDVSIASTHWTTSTIAFTTGKWYAEFTVGSTGTIQMFGVCSADFFGSELVYPWGTSSAKDVTYYVADGRVYVSAVNTGTTSSASAGDVISFAVDADTRSVAIRKNNTLLTTKTIAASTAGYVFYVSSGGGSCTATLNFGARSFSYQAPSGFKSLNTASLPSPLVTKPSTVMDVKLYTGNGSTQTISGLGFSPDLVWLKARSAAYNNTLYDTIRGAGKYLISNATDAEGSSTNYLSSFTSDGFSLGSNNNTNASSITYAGWCFDAGSSTVTNTQGSITSSVRANATAGFSICTFTFNSTGTVGHGLGVAPEFIIVKTRGTSAQWFVYHKSLGTSKYIRLSFTGEAVTFADAWSPVNSTVFQMEAGLHTLSTYVAYCFAPVAGYSAFGSYTGNGSADGPFVYTGFRPRWVLIKCSSLGGSNFDWFIYDAARDGINASYRFLTANSSGAETVATGGTYTDMYIDILSSGFKVRTNYQSHNSNTNTYIYAAFAESPFQYARAR